MASLIPFIEENIPLPSSAVDAFPPLTASEELTMRANVIKLMSDLTGQPLSVNQDNIDEAKTLAKEMIENPRLRPNYAKYPNETLAFLAGMVAQMNVSIVEDLADFKLYVVNKLVQEVETGRDAKSRLTALRSLGEVDGVDAFKRRSELTIKMQSIEEVEKELLATLESIEIKAIDVEAREFVSQANENNEWNHKTYSGTTV